MKKLILDTNAMLRFLLKDIPSQHKKVENLFIKASRSKLILKIPEVIVFEVMFTLDKYYGYDRDQIINIISSIISTYYVEVESRSIFFEAIELYKNERIEFVDCFLLIKSKNEKFDLFTFDIKLVNLFKSFR